MWNVFESMENTNQQTELSLVEKWNSLCNLLTWIIWSTCCVKLCIIWPRNNDYIASVQCLLPESTLKACTVLTNFENFGFLFPMALVCSVPCSCDRQSNWNLDWKFMFPLVRKSVINYVVIYICLLLNLSCELSSSMVNNQPTGTLVGGLIPSSITLGCYQHSAFLFLVTLWLHLCMRDWFQSTVWFIYHHFLSCDYCLTWMNCSIRWVFYLQLVMVYVINQK